MDREELIEEICRLLKDNAEKNKEDVLDLLSQLYEAVVTAEPIPPEVFEEEGEY